MLHVGSYKRSFEPVLSSLLVAGAAWSPGSQRGPKHDRPPMEGSRVDQGKLSESNRPRKHQSRVYATPESAAGDDEVADATLCPRVIATPTTISVSKCMLNLLGEPNSSAQPALAEAVSVFRRLASELGTVLPDFIHTDAGVTEEEGLGDAHC